MRVPQAHTCLQVQVDVDETIGTEYNISCVPTFQIFKNGQKLDAFEGGDEARLRAAIASSST